MKYYPYAVTVIRQNNEMNITDFSIFLSFNWLIVFLFPDYRGRNVIYWAFRSRLAHETLFVHPIFSSLSKIIRVCNITTGRWRFIYF